VEGWTTAEDQQLHLLHRPAQVVEWEEIRRLKLERQKSAAAAQRAVRAATKRSLHHFLKTHPKLSIVAVQETPTYQAVLREAWPSVETQEWKSDLEIRFLKDVYWREVGCELRTLEHQINRALECLCSTLFPVDLPTPEQQTLLVAYQLTNTLTGVVDDLLASFLVTGNVWNISSFSSAGPGWVARTTAETLLQRIERVHSLAMEVQGPEPWYQTSQKKIQLELELSWLQPPNPNSGWDGAAAWQEIVGDQILPLGVEKNWEDVVRRWQELPVFGKLKELRLQNSERQTLVQVTAPLMRASAQLDQLLDQLLDPKTKNHPEHVSLVQKGRQIRSENGVESLRLKFAAATKPVTVHWWTNQVTLACDQMKVMCAKLDSRSKNLSNSCVCQNAAAKACTYRLCGVCCLGCPRHGR
jgi:hypothetical protein